MILVDSSVWIAYFHNVETDAVRRLKAVPKLRHVLVGDLVMLEVLQGARSDAAAAKLETALVRFNVVALSSPTLAIAAAANYRRLRALGVTVRRSIDVIIATYCIEHDHHLLHQDRDFDHFQRHLGLRVY